MQDSDPVNNENICHKRSYNRHSSANISTWLSDPQAFDFESDEKVRKAHLQEQITRVDRAGLANSDVGSKGYGSREDKLHHGVLKEKDTALASIGAWDEQLKR